MILRTLLWVAIGLALLTTGAQASEAELIDRAEAAYSRSDFTAAKSLYLQAIVTMGERGAVNGHLLYNLGNCYFRLQQYGWALLQYRRARLFLPDDRDLLANMETAADKLKVPLADDGGLLQRLCFWVPYFSFQTLWWALVSVNLLASLWWLSRRLLPQPRRIWGDATLLPLLGLLLLSLAVKMATLRQSTGTVIGATAEIRSGKGDDFIPIVRLSEGARFTVLESDPESAWWKIAVDAGEQRKGYAKSTALAKLGAWNLVRGKNISSLFSREYSEASIDTPPPPTVQ